ncbi:hypothetical protein [Paludisphaera mucosa]|uniref:Filamentous hemagglutinin n=1 Tax=Paludisphaera mucosa TaxID=3030827 RepID=A0ABT6F706_9BACT|nr:hypothetical protein [Paludisphaera mucosa]MDG3003339.1 hypothetical protein [Paludisphaera mucosa]
MITPTGIARGLGVLGVIGFMALATTSSSIATPGLRQEPGATPAPAHDEPAKIPAPTSPSPADAAPVPLEPEPIKELPPAPDEPALEPVVPQASSEVAPSTPKPTAAPALIVAPAEEPANPLPPARQLEPKPIVAPAAPSEPAAAAPAPIDDPDARARSFVERNRKEAEGQLKALREESAQLRSRLARVEAGIRRWEALSEALDRSQEKAVVRPQDGLEPAARPRVRGDIQYMIPGRTSGVVIQSQPVTRADFVPAPLPR